MSSVPTGGCVCCAGCNAAFHRLFRHLSWNARCVAFCDSLPSDMVNKGNKVSSSLKSVQFARMCQRDGCKTTIPVIGSFCPSSVYFSNDDSSISPLPHRTCNRPFGCPCQPGTSVSLCSNRSTLLDLANSWSSCLCSFNVVEVKLQLLWEIRQATSLISRHVSFSLSVCHVFKILFAQETYKKARNHCF